MLNTMQDCKFVSLFTASMMVKHTHKMHCNFELVILVTIGKIFK